MRVLLALIVLCSLLTGAGAQVLAPGDTISVSVYQDPKLDRQIVIGPTGMISFPLAGQIKAGGMTPETLESTIKAKLKDKYTTDLDVTVTLVASKAEAVAREPRPLEEDLKPRIYVTGEVLRPGPYVMRLRMTVLQAIAVSGGFGLYAAKKRVQVRRQILGREVTYLFDYEAFHKGRNVEDNIDLIPGDVVIVPERGLFE